ncbi:protein transport protein SFT2 [Cimex lectularius]|uniref:Vesicle transport protein n=1 Tax=Cimex lectularius TaxID=79782 RepID=A0A8I6TK01_CIMLE|nr:protein transport protein SFT2 [Cimex lectularius]
MANLKTELDEYLNRNSSDSKPLLNGISASVSMPNVGSWFKKNEQSDEAETWFTGAQKDCCPTLSRFQRIVGFCMFLGMGIFCFCIAAMYIPVLLLKARKFALLYTTGSFFTICSFSFLWGPMHHLRHLFSKERFWFTFCYLGSLFLTLYFALYQQSTPLTVLSAVAQLIALIWFLVSYIPGGHTGLLFFTKLCSSAVASSVSKTLPV